MRPMRTLPLLVVLCLASSAHAQVFKCVDADGRITYTNDRNLARGCQPLAGDQSVSSVPAPRPATTPSPASSSPSFPRVTPDTQRARDDTRRQVLQRELETEEQALAAARQALEDEEKRDVPEERNVRRTQDGRSYSSVNTAKTDERLKPFRDKVEMHQRNLEALRKELSGLR
ncbi:DUF4124 domain-containing protein [Azoarcus communis]|uniref:DUF4124 domain-containing protein n=2 Tax=Parazoarcus communis TaxID=41977 RepID=A0A323UTG7_9RHOO|nr:DUF4124 domain-containing protein [Parazoarcus communis]NMG50295.1 DUF4124 domain-containing protein [Parazoarcus communis]NMG71331.1 DUF4124 domain-containing protein [Parazoarcus communis SWub3 = DSM 12120]PZA15687.1 DUF4124 domain-containing protein [Azoarcus communis] [Parazoarcus communis SWub3 = DSM 12120]